MSKKCCPYCGSDDVQPSDQEGWLWCRQCDADLQPEDLKEKPIKVVGVSVQPLTPEYMLEDYPKLAKRLGEEQAACAQAQVLMEKMIPVVEAAVALYLARDAEERVCGDDAAVARSARKARAQDLQQVVGIYLKKICSRCGGYQVILDTPEGGQKPGGPPKVPVRCPDCLDEDGAD